VPKADTNWVKFTIRPHCDILILEHTNFAGGKDVFYVDTGAKCGVALSPNQWRKWETAHANSPMTLNAGFVQDTGITISKQTFAEMIAVGPLPITDVLVEGDLRGGKSPAELTACLGMEALKRLDVVIDGRHNLAYLRPRPRGLRQKITTASAPYFVRPISPART